MPDNYYGHMFGWGWGGDIMMLAFWALVILLVVWGVKEISGRKGDSPSRSALDILKERYAKGEVDKEEYEAKKKDLES